MLPSAAPLLPLPVLRARALARAAEHALGVAAAPCVVVQTSAADGAALALSASGEVDGHIWRALSSANSIFSIAAVLAKESAASRGEAAECLSATELPPLAAERRSTARTALQPRCHARMAGGNPSGNLPRDAFVGTRRGSVSDVGSMLAYSGGLESGSRSSLLVEWFALPGLARSAAAAADMRCIANTALPPRCHARMAGGSPSGICPRAVFDTRNPSGSFPWDTIVVSRPGCQVILSTARSSSTRRTRCLEDSGSIGALPLNDT